jgi:hypothetical protein
MNLTYIVNCSRTFLEPEILPILSVSLTYLDLGKVPSQKHLQGTSWVFSCLVDVGVYSITPILNFGVSPLHDSHSKT